MSIDWTTDETFDEFTTEEVEELEETNTEVETDTEVEDTDVKDNEETRVEDNRGSEETTTVEETNENSEESEKNEKSEESEEDGEEVRFVDELAQDFGIEFDEEIPDTWDGLKTATKKAAEIQAQRQMETFMEEYPDIAQYAQYRVNGGDPKKYQEQVLGAPSYEDMEVGDESTQEQLVRERLRSEGYNDETIDEEIEDYKSAGLLKKQAERSKTVLSKRQKEKQEELVKQQEEQRQQVIQQQKEIQQQYVDLIQDASDFAGLRIPENKKDDFTQHMFEPIDESGTTQAEQAWNSMSEEDALAIEYLVYQSGGNGLDLTDLVDNLASTKKAKSISDSLRKTRKNKRNVNDRSSNSRMSATSSNVDDIDMDQIFNS